MLFCTDFGWQLDQIYWTKRKVLCVIIAVCNNDIEYQTTICILRGDDVITPELCHLIHRDHTQAFIALLETEMPDWKRWKEKLESMMTYSKQAIKKKQSALPVIPSTHSVSFFLIPLNITLCLASLVPLQILQDACIGSKREVIILPTTKR